MANRQKKSGSGGGGLFFVVVLAVGGYGAYRVMHDVAANHPSGGGTSSADRPGAASYALKAADESWPPLAQGAPPQVDMNAAGAANYYVVLDGSGSMQERHCSGNTNKIQAAVKALYKFVDSVPANANLGLAAFDSKGTSERVALGAGDVNRADVRRALDKVRAEGGTPLKSAISLGYEKLLDQGRRQLGYGEYHLVVVTDGVPDPASEDPTEVVQDVLAHTPVILHTIGFCIGEDHVLNQPGRSFYVAANSPEQLQQGLGAVLAEAPSFDATKFNQ